MSKVDTICAFESGLYDYYKLTKKLGALEAGAIFYHDPEDDSFGSVSNGCLKLCHTPDGGCYGGLCGGTVIFHTSFVESDLFEKVERSFDNLACGLKDGTYKFTITDGNWELRKMSGYYSR